MIILERKCHYFEVIKIGPRYSRVYIPYNNFVIYNHPMFIEDENPNFLYFFPQSKMIALLSIHPYIEQSPLSY